MTRGPSYFLGLHVIRTPGPACAFSRQAQRTGHRRTSFQQLFAPIVYFYAKYFSTIIRIWLSPLIINKIFFSPSHCLLLAFIRQPLPHLTPYPLLDASLISSISRPRRLLVLAPPQTRHGYLLSSPQTRPLFPSSPRARVGFVLLIAAPSCSARRSDQLVLLNFFVFFLAGSLNAGKIKIGINGEFVPPQAMLFFLLVWSCLVGFGLI